MTSAYLSNGGSRRAGVWTAIIGLHVGLYAAILSGLGPPVLDAWKDWQPPVSPLPPPPQRPVEQPVFRGPADGPVIAVDKPEIVIPDFDGAGEQTVTVEPAMASAGNGTLRIVEYLPPALRTRDSRLAALVNACYPAAARRQGEEGTAVAMITVGAQASALSWRLHQSSGFPRLDAAMDCVIRRLEFVPARRDGRAVAAEVLLPIVFRLD